MDNKKIHPTEPQWDNNVEQEIFGNQAPFAGTPSASNNNTSLPLPQHTSSIPSPSPSQQQQQQYPPAGSSSRSTPAPAAPSQADQPFIFPHYPTQQSHLDSPYSQQPRPNKGAFKDVQVPEDAPPMYTKDPNPIIPAPPAPLSIPLPQHATAPSSPSPSTAASAPPAHSQPRIQDRPPQESLPRVLPAQTQHAPYPNSHTPLLQQPSVPLSPSSERTPLSPQSHSPTAPAFYQQSPPPPSRPDRQSPHTASYGAIRHPSHPQGYSRNPQRTQPRTQSDSESSNSSTEDEDESIAAGERRRRRKALKKHLSGCSCNKICWFLIFLVLLSFWASPIEKSIKDPCTLMAERRLNPVLESYSLGSPSYLNVTIDITEYVLGNITVLEADSWMVGHIRANIYKTFSDPDLNDVIDFQIIDDKKYETSLLRADLHSTDEEGRKREAKIMKNNCARIDIELIYPKSSNSHMRLAGKTRKGGHIRIRTEGKLVIFDDLQMETTVGDILFEAGSVKNSAKLKTGKGKIQGTIRSQQQVEATTTLGDIALVVDASPGELGASFDKLNITLQSAKSSINLELTQRYHGWFSLKSGIDKPTFTLSPNYTDIVSITKSSATSLAGWVLERFSEPPRQPQLPTVSARAMQGLVDVRVVPKPKKN